MTSTQQTTEEVSSLGYRGSVPVGLMGEVMLPLEHLHLEHVLQVVCALESVVLRSFGPEGGHVLFTRDTGQAMLSRSGIRILTALRLEHPLARMVVECVFKHSAVIGDGSKTFILLLASLVRMIHTTACKEPNVSHAYNSREAAKSATARHLADELLAFALEYLDDLIATGVVPYGCCLSREGFTAKTQDHTNSDCVQKLLASFFHSRLGRTHCDFISNLTCDLLNHWKFDRSSLLFVNDNFPALHTAVSGFPLSCSRLIEGQVIHRDFATLCPQTHGQPVKAVVFTGCLQPKLLSAGEVLELQCEQGMKENSSKDINIMHFTSWTERSLESVISNLQSAGVSVLLSAVKQSAAVLALAAQADMCVVECVSEDELSLFARLSGTRPVSDCWRIEPDHVATLTFCQPILLGAHRYVQVAFRESEERVEVEPCSLVVCGPGEGQADQSAGVLRDAIRMLLSTWEPVGLTAASQRTFQSNENTDDQVSSAPVLQPGCVIPAGGMFEFLLSDALLKHRHDTDKGVPAVSQLLANALLSVPRQIYSPRGFLQTQTRLLALVHNNSRNFNLANKQEEKGFMLNSGLESVSCKYQLLLSVLQCASRLFQVDAVVRTHTALHKQSRRVANISWEDTEDED